MLMGCLVKLTFSEHGAAGAPFIVGRSHGEGPKGPGACAPSGDLGVERMMEGRTVVWNKWR